MPTRKEPASEEFACPPFSSQHATFNHVWSSLLLEELFRLGVRDIALAPGSRSAPLTMAAAAHQGFRRHLHFDERGLGFMALGLAKGSNRPVAVIMTSGTAVANLWPAVAEAQLTGVPLIILSADRPHELIDNGANQAIDQQGIFGRYPVYQQNLPSPTPTIPAAFVLSSVDQALAKQALTPGVVHFNCMYPEPLYPGEHYQDFSDYLAPLGDWLGSHKPWSPWQQSAPSCPPQAEWETFRQQRGIIVAGRITDPEQAQVVAALAEQLGWPLLADLQSQIRFDSRNLIHMDMALNDPEFVAELGRAEVLLQFGARLVSKRLGQFIKHHSWQDYWLVDPQPARLDPDYRLRNRLLCSASAFAAAHPVTTQAPWHTLAELQHNASQQIAAACEHFSELGVCHRLNRLIEGQLFVGNSMPARLMDMLGETGKGPSRVMTNRGASGIDGLIATAYGFAQSIEQGSNEPTTLLLGDLSALHDLNSLALLSKASRPLVVILLNNDGGSIFRMLPVPTEGELLESYYRLPHGLSFEHAAAMFGLAYRAPTTLAEFERDYRAALQHGVTLIEIRVPSEQVADDLKALGAAIRGK
ncbi:2-succinyl-5-enolpyruvyl-6-hydroxy-3-cyclohexene-1-carboxylic-acid synthase [Aeromonas veronii]|uniref:2-succinyl-5-enolpyruvyl-6-hydroxy-3- cyclohexene-1-carboxylic-acid synthase n=1 Tax=Aeromonas veronii TaxID=654 RepID=UPI000206A0B0|nr:2-succinyl-5-enolpyruvyl-6-hydroxy-3-cyclohexene-1-carboxylic-acid synthase [Aeromonas veronii]AEB48521.1 2-succinyl-5-enolpyruvyl-6-hydroxy-3-cyclohexene-1-carboxylate synthase [Aeromonas veronii B565]EKB11130.1 2-succinyl-5-enolpyruvyl-6-hydroxy-3-cyclohexene-1-carboxylate synthase [Aeromonas veronii AER397]MBS4693048.1 2-succinyl-5-enolpyruvyl-6-hydroxy-3-cyclohexene-1-carboxylic-acid synthase [Aeromonas veronii bv. veronii]OKP37491.1 2-succinyl-5-enolpyruvyl-6-hydroxy-3-cyclohexene-1-car